MSGDPVEVGVDLYRLWVAGKVLLPQVATVYEQDNQDLHNTSYQEEQAFNRQGVASPVAASWQGLRDSLQTLMGQTAITIDQAGMALCHIANEYAAMDQAAAEVMQAQIDNYQSNPELPQPPGPIDIENPNEGHEVIVGQDDIAVPVR